MHPAPHMSFIVYKERKIDIVIYEGSEDSIIVEGILKDDRHLESYRFTGESIPPGTIHHMIIRIEVKGLLRTSK